MKCISTSVLVLLGYSIISLIVSISILDDHNGKELWMNLVGEFKHDGAPVVISITNDETGATLPTRGEPRRTVHRFPEYGTTEFDTQCPWTAYKGNTGNCTIFVRPRRGQHEGISDWISQIVTGHIYAQQAGCNLVFDYGPSIDMTQIMTPFPNSQNWTLPTPKRTDELVFDLYGHGTPMHIQFLSKSLGIPIVYTTSFRFTYRMAASHDLYRDQFDDLAYSLAGFQPETAVACSLASLFNLAPAIAQFQPNLFTEILPALRSSDALVMTLYVRTLQSDRSATNERDNVTDPYKERQSYRAGAKAILDCALGLEESMLKDNPHYTRVIWMLVSDSQDVKHWITETYDTSSNASSHYSRKVITTTSRGAHTRTWREPSTADLAEALIDWYLIGESLLVVKDEKSPSFGGTAALRTARPLYDASPKGKCTMIPPIHERPMDTSKAKESNDSIMVEPAHRRFPMYGTAAFSRQCAWTEHKVQSENNCTLLLRPIPNGNEGISDFVAQIVTAHVYAVQAGCHLLFDYGEGTDLSPVVTPFPGSIDWRVPYNFTCTANNHCFELQRFRPLTRKRGISNLASALGAPVLAYVPSIRFAYHFAAHFHLYRDEFEDVQRALHGFEPETAMACSLGSLLCLNPSANQVEPGLFSTILKPMYIESALVMTIYIRTGRTDHVAREEKENATIKDGDQNDHSYQTKAKRVIDCAIQLEKEKLAASKSYYRVVWMVVTDSKDLKQWIHETYESKSDPSRMILTTGSSGAHTRTGRSPSNMELSEALLDWYLIGESDLVVSDQQHAPSFGGTAALRTARPLYDASKFGKCALATPIHERVSVDKSDKA